MQRHRCRQLDVDGLADASVEGDRFACGIRWKDLAKRPRPAPGQGQNHGGADRGCSPRGERHVAEHTDATAPMTADPAHATRHRAGRFGSVGMIDPYVAGSRRRTRVATKLKLSCWAAT